MSACFLSLRRYFSCCKENHEEAPDANLAQEDNDFDGWLAHSIHELKHIEWLGSRKETTDDALNRLSNFILRLSRLQTRRDLKHVREKLLFEQQQQTTK
jgi:hypothetical protein